jgi:hypothetical protein
MATVEELSDELERTRRRLAAVISAGDALAHAVGRPQWDACDRCSQGVMDTDNSHARGLCDCDCHAERLSPARRTALAVWLTVTST